MSIKGKLTFILVLIGAVLGSLAGFVAWNTWQTARQVRIVAPAIDFLHGAGAVRLHSYQQVHDLAHFLLFNEEGGKKRFDADRALIEDTFPKLKASIRQQISLESERDEAELDYVADIESAYARLIPIFERAVREKRSGNRRAAAAIMEKEAEPLLESEFFTAVNNAVGHEAEEILDNYDEIVLRVGVMPWRLDTSLREIRGARRSILYFLATDRLFSAFNRQFNEAVEYIMFGGEENQQDFEEAGTEAAESLQECRRIIESQITIDMEGEREQRDDLDVLEKEYRRLVQVAEAALQMRAAGKAAAAIEVMERDLKPRLDTVLYPKVDSMLDGSIAEITAAHRVLIRSIVATGVLLVVAISAFSAVLFFVSHRIIRTLMKGIGTLKEGADIIGSGDLNHRIPVDTQDELGDLAASFNSMTASLKDGNEDLRSFIYSLSHDLRSPLVNIKGFTGELQHTLKELEKLLERNCGHLATDDRTRLQAMLHHDLPGTMGFIGNAAVRINELVNAVLKLSLIGQRDTAPRVIDMTELVTSAVDRFGGEIRQRNVAVRINDLPPVTADRADMEEIVANILDNALKYCAQDRRGDVEISGQRTNGEVVYRFRDNGRGIASDDLVRIFGLFRRSGQQDVPGDGMGLAYVKALVRRNRGRVWCESEVGVGTTFHVAIPDAKNIDDNHQ